MACQHCPWLTGCLFFSRHRRQHTRGYKDSSVYCQCFIFITLDSAFCTSSEASACCSSCLCWVSPRLVLLERQRRLKSSSSSTRATRWARCDSQLLSLFQFDHLNHFRVFTISTSTQTTTQRVMRRRKRCNRATTPAATLCRICPQLLQVRMSIQIEL